jgi:hypothetical protein
MKNLIAPEVARQIEAALATRHQAELANTHVRVEGHREGQRLFARLTLTRDDKSLHYPMEAGKSLVGDTREEEEDTLALLVDFLADYLAEYLGSRGEVLLPIDWARMQFGDEELFARGWERNLALEEAADRWLAGEEVEVPQSADERRKNLRRL